MSNLPAAGEIWDDAIPADSAERPSWVWEGLIAQRNLTLLTSQWKAGKTTLLSVLLGLRAGGGELAGLKVRPGKTLVVTEEPLSLWAERARKHGFGGQVCFIPQPFRSIPTEQEWQDLLDRALAINARHGVDLVAIDPLAPFLRSENLARSMLETLMPLGQLQRAGMAVWLLHHPGRGERALGQAARGSGALLGHVDISIEMRHPGGDALTRRRRLFTLSRHAISPRQLLLELDEAGTAYTLAPPTEEERFEASWEPVRLVLAEAPQKLTRQDILMEWPAGFDLPSETTVWRWLDRAVEQGLVQCEGSGHKNDPFRYWTAERVAVWQQDPLYDLIEGQRRSLNLPFVSLAQRREKLRTAGEAGDDGE